MTQFYNPLTKEVHLVKRGSLFVSASTIRPDKVKVIFPAVTSVKAHRLHLLHSVPQVEVSCSGRAIASVIYDAYMAI